MHFARFVRAVLAPHHAEDTELRDVGIAAENLLDASVLVASDAVLRGNLGSDFDFDASGSHLYDSLPSVDFLFEIAFKSGGPIARRNTAFFSVPYRLSHCQIARDSEKRAKLAPYSQTAS